MGDSVESTRREFLGGVAATIAAGALPHSGPAFAESKRPPNILWIMTDEQRTDTLGCYGNPWAKSPNLDRLASSGVTFRNAFVQSPICMPSRSAMLTGKYGHTCEMLMNGYNLNVTSWHRKQIADALEKMGPDEFNRRVKKLGSEAAKKFQGKYTTDLPVAFERNFGEAILIATLNRELGLIGQGPQHKMFPEIFAENGYHTTHVGKLHHGSPHSGFQDTIQQPDHEHAWWFGLRKGYNEEEYNLLSYPGGAVFAGTFPAPASETTSAKWTDIAIERLKQATELPFLLRLSLRSPHTPVLPPKPFDSMFDSKDMPIPHPTREELVKMSLYDRGQLPNLFDEEQTHRIWASYFGLASFVDNEIGRLLDALAASPHADNTIVVFNSDHGTMLGEHDLLQKSVFYDLSARVPLIISWPGRIPEGKKVDDLVEFIDVAPTLFDLAEINTPADMEGQNLRNTMNGTANPRDAVFSEIYTGKCDMDWLRGEAPGSIRRMIRTEEWCFAMNYPEDPQCGPDGALYNVVEDPDEVKNLYDDKKHGAVIANLRKQLIDWVGE